MGALGVVGGKVTRLIRTQAKGRAYGVVDERYCQFL